ncbi:MAG TPA: MCE family protein [Acidimicrobiales bacterium]|nr:MCE family protein [Acidimicrobiales bacterium]
MSRGWRITRSVVAPVVTAVTVLLLGGCALSLQSLPKFSGIGAATYPVHAVFANVLNLPTDAQVRIGAEVVGQVGRIGTQDFKADLTLDIKRSVHLPQGTTAQIRFDNPLGDEYVLLQAPSVLTSSIDHLTPRFLAPGAVIPEGSTSTAPSVEDTFGALSLVLNGGGINQLETIIHELNDTFDGNQPPIRSFLTTIDQGVSALAGGRTAIDGALASMANLSRDLNGGGTTIANGINSIAPAVAVLASENTQITGLIAQLSNLGAVGTQVAQQSGQNSVNDAKDLLPVVQQLESVSAQLAPDLGDLASFEAESPKVVPGDYLQVSAIVNVFLPSGSFEATPLAGSSDERAAAASGSRPTDGARAVADLLTASLA